MFNTQNISDMIIGFTTYRMLEAYVQDLKARKKQQKEAGKTEGDQAKSAQNKVRLAKANDDMNKLKTDRERRDIEDAAKILKAQQKLKDALQQAEDNE